MTCTRQIPLTRKDTLTPTLQKAGADKLEGVEGYMCHGELWYCADDGWATVELRIVPKLRHESAQQAMRDMEAGDTITVGIDEYDSEMWVAVAYRGADALWEMWWSSGWVRVPPGRFR